MYIIFKLDNSKLQNRISRSSSDSVLKIELNEVDVDKKECGNCMKNQILVNQYRNDLKIYKDKVISLENEIKKLRSENAESKENLEKFEEMLTEMSKRDEDNVLTLTSSISVHSVKGQEVESLLEYIDSLTTEINNIKEANNNKIKQIEEDKNYEIAKLTERIFSLTNKENIEKKTKYEKELTKSIKSKFNYMENLEKENKKLNREVEQLKTPQKPLSKSSYSSTKSKRKISTLYKLVLLFFSIIFTFVIICSYLLESYNNNNFFINRFTNGINDKEMSYDTIRCYYEEKSPYCYNKNNMCIIKEKEEIEIGNKVKEKVENTEDIIENNDSNNSDFISRGFHDNSLDN